MVPEVPCRLAMWRCGYYYVAAPARSACSHLPTLSKLLRCLPMSPTVPPLPLLSCRLRAAWAPRTTLSSPGWTSPRFVDERVTDMSHSKVCPRMMCMHLAMHSVAPCAEG